MLHDSDFSLNKDDSTAQRSEGHQSDQKVLPAGGMLRRDYKNSRHPLAASRELSEKNLRRQGSSPVDKDARLSPSPTAQICHSRRID
jgi:hypothetical protein